MVKDKGELTEKQLVLFDLGGEAYGVDIAKVYEIIRVQPITKVPKAPFFVEGVINLRGKIIPIVDLRKRFGLSIAQQSNNNRIMIMDSSGQNVGIIVDAVTEVLRLPAESVEPTSNIMITAASGYLAGIAKHNGNMIILLDLDKVLSKEAVASVANLTSSTMTGAENNIPEMAFSGSSRGDNGQKNVS